MPSRLWYTRPLPKWAELNMLICKATNKTTATSIKISNPVALHLIAHHCRHARVLHCFRQGLISKVDDERLPPLINMRELSIQSPHQGSEHLFDRQLLPNLRSIRSDCSCLFSALIRMSSTDPRYTQLTHIERLELIEREESFSLKQWYTILDGFPRLRSLSLSFLSKRCPPERWIDVLIDHLQSKKTSRLVLLSINMLMNANNHDKALFMNYFGESIQRRSHVEHLVRPHNARFDAWF